jgi:hypothetical protein
MALWAVVVRDRRGRPRAALVLCDSFDDLAETTTIAGTDGGQRGAVLAVETSAARALAAAVADALGQRRALPTLWLGPLPAGDQVVDAFAAALGGTETVELDPIPVVRRCTAHDADAYLSHGISRTLRKSWNRLSRDGRSARIDFSTDPGHIVAHLPELAEHHRDRDHRGGRPSDLDDEAGSRLWHERMYALAEVGELELATLTIDGELAAYVLGIIDGSVYRLGEGRFVTPWARYAPGRLLEAAVLQRVLDNPELDTLDWMTAVASESLLAANDADAMVAIRFRAT